MLGKIAEPAVSVAEPYKSRIANCAGSKFDRNFFLLFMSPLFIYSFSSAQPTGTPLQKDTVAFRYSNYISKEDLKKHLTIISSDDFEGRETGKPGQKKAADYISSQFRSFGIPALKDGSYLQKFDVFPSTSSKTAISFNNKEYELGIDFYSTRGTSDVPIECDSIVLCGYGIADKKYSDYENA